MGKLIVELPNELHTQLKQRAAAGHTTLKIIVTSLLRQHLSHAGGHGLRKHATGLCGAWKDRRSAREISEDLRVSRQWRIGAD